VDWEHDWGMEPLKWLAHRKGPADVAGFFGTLSDFEFHRFEPVNLLEGGNQVMAVIRTEIGVKATGKVFRDLEAHLWTFGPEGEVTAFRHMIDTRQMAAATS
jgi:ketosteroid isomerase-like protein